MLQSPGCVRSQCDLKCKTNPLVQRKSCKETTQKHKKKSPVRHAKQHQCVKNHLCFIQRYNTLWCTLQTEWWKYLFLQSSKHFGHFLWWVYWPGKSGYTNQAPEKPRQKKMKLHPVEFKQVNRLFTKYCCCFFLKKRAILLKIKMTVTLNNLRHISNLQPSEWKAILQSVLPILLREGVQQHIIHLTNRQRQGALFKIHHSSNNVDQRSKMKREKYTMPRIHVCADYFR